MNNSSKHALYTSKHSVVNKRNTAIKLCDIKALKLNVH
jgi:hypothetical protein